jgi:hypothetical protein
MTSTRRLYESLSALVRSAESLPLAPVESPVMLFSPSSQSPTDLALLGSVSANSARLAEELVFLRDSSQFAFSNSPIRFKLTPAEGCRPFDEDELRAVASLVQVSVFAGPAEGDAPLPFETSPSLAGNCVYVSVALPAGDSFNQVTVLSVQVASAPVPLTPSPLVVTIVPWVETGTPVSAR